MKPRVQFVNEMDRCIESLEREIKESPGKEWTPGELMESISSIVDEDRASQAIRWAILMTTLYCRHHIKEEDGKFVFLRRRHPTLQPPPGPTPSELESLKQEHGLA